MTTFLESGSSSESSECPSPASSPLPLPDPSPLASEPAAWHTASKWWMAALFVMGLAVVSTYWPVPFLRDVLCALALIAGWLAVRSEPDSQS